MPPISLEAVATVKYRNPFKGRGWDIANHLNPGGMRHRNIIEPTMPPVAPDVIDARDADLQLIRFNPGFAAKFATYANSMGAAIMDKELMDEDQLKRISNSIASRG
jgi:hypothetical protein